jgi:hypothetical protein
MKKISVLLVISAFTISNLFVASASAATIISGSTLNGNFESGFDSDPDTTVDNWTTGLNAVENQFKNTGGPGNVLVGTNGAVTAVLGQQSSANGENDLGVIQNTGYTVSLGETFDLSFDWANAYQWATGDTLDWQLFTSDDNTLGGTLTVIASDSIQPDAAINNWESESYTGIGTVVAANVGQQLWIEFSATQDADPGNDGYFARLDNVVLTSIPEPSAALLVGCGFGLLVLLRRRS